MTEGRNGDVKEFNGRLVGSKMISEKEGRGLLKYIVEKKFDRPNYDYVIINSSDEH